MWNTEKMEIKHELNGMVLSNAGKPVLFLRFSGQPKQKRFYTWRNPTSTSLGFPRSFSLNQPPEHNPVLCKCPPSLDPLSVGDRGSLNQGFKPVNGHGESQSEWRHFMPTKWAPDPLSHGEPNNWLEECSHFSALGVSLKKQSSLAFGRVVKICLDPWIGGNK